MITKHIKFLLLICFLVNTRDTPAAPAQNSASQRQALLNSLKPFSISQLFAFYELYPNTREGQQALKKAFELLGSKDSQQNIFNSSLISEGIVGSLIKVVNRDALPHSLHLSSQQLATIEKLSSRLANRKLKGYYANSENEVLKLASNDVDLARGMLLSQLEETSDKMNAIRQYEAILDLMALQILGYLQPFGGIGAPIDKKIEVINQFVFYEMHFRFPPQSSYSPEIDKYTFLSSVIDNRRGVCLGVSLLYIALAQRLNLPIEVITPPGHIYLRSQIGDTIHNIETTARGIDLPSDTYLGVNTKTLQIRTIKETIGMAHFNQASMYSQRGDYDKAVRSYLKAEQYLTSDILLQELLAYHFIFAGNQARGKALLKSIEHLTPEEKVSKSTIISDYLNEKVDVEGIKAIFLEVDETQDSLLKKKNTLEAILKEFPQFREGILHLAATWIQLKREKEALHILKQYHAIDAQNPTIEYYLAVLYAQRFDYKNAWTHLSQCEKITAASNHYPQALKELRQALRQLAPE